MGQIFFKLGDIFEGGSDITVLPCSSKGSVSTATQRWLSLWKIRLPKRWPLALGDISEPIRFPGPEERTKHIVFAASVYNKTSSAAIIEKIAARLACVANDKAEIHIIETPLLGTGAGHLLTEVAGKALYSGFSSASSTDTALHVRVYDQERLTVLERMVQELSSSKQGGKMQQCPRVFVSHCSKDADVASALVELLACALVLDPKDIRCTSVDGYKLGAGAHSSVELRKDISGADLVAGLITPASVDSSYVLFELGAAWGLLKSTFPLLAKGARYSDVPGPLIERNALDLSKATHIQKMLDDAVDSSGLQLRPGVADRVQTKVEALSKAARRRR